MRRLDVLVLGLNYPPEVTGIAPYTHGVAQALAAAGHRVHVVAGYPHYPQWRIARGYRGLRRAEVDGDVRVTRVRHPVPARPTGVGRILLEVVFALSTLTVRAGRADVVVAVSPALLTVGAGRLRTRFTSGRPPLGVVVQDLYGAAVNEVGVLGGRGGGLVARVESTLLAQATGVATIHEVMRRSVLRTGVTAPVTVLRNWTHTAAPTTDAAAHRAGLGWPADRIIALHAGNMGAKQGLENVVAAARLAQQRDLPIEFVLLGDGSTRARLQELAAGCSRIRFVEPVPAGRFENTLAAADVLVVNELASIRDMCVPSKLTSYFAAARPVVAACAPDGATAVEIGRSGAGVVVAPERPDLLLEAALRIGLEPGDAGARGAAYAERTMSAATAAAGYVAWVESLVHGPVPGRPGGRHPSRRRTAVVPWRRFSLRAAVRSRATRR